MEGNDLLTIALLLIGFAVVWTILRSVLKLTARLFSIGCIAIVLLVGGVWLVTTVF